MHICNNITFRKEKAARLRRAHRNLRQTGLRAGPRAHIYARIMASAAPSLDPSHPQVNAFARPLAIARWLEITACFVVLIVLVGGITRLTESGLSITEWDVATGILPPLTDEVWQEEFAKYRATPEYRLEASIGGMSLADFKFIYFWEWFHRLLARLVGLVYALPLVWFWAKGAIPTGYKPRLVALLALGGLQGLFGWLMVQSGLVGDMTDVSHFRLSLHLLTALLLLAGLVWTARDMRRIWREPGVPPAPMTGASMIVAVVLFIQLLLGAWVAGLNAGHTAYDWPLMNGRFVPEVDLSYGFFWTLTHDPFLLHFLHRWWAWLAVAALVWLARRVRKTDRLASILVHSAFGTMILLGIATVLSGVELWIAAAHQLVGALLVASTAWAMHSDGAAQQSKRLTEGTLG
ncbi:Heme A synthase [Erythrobacter sp. THAF29]|nr:Heme A synthase [Erythrobacter sp. THAF29]